MNDESKTRAQLVEVLRVLRQQVAESKKASVIRGASVAVRIKTASMDKPEDLYDVITEIRTQLHNLGWSTKKIGSTW